MQLLYFRTNECKKIYPFYKHVFCLRWRYLLYNFKRRNKRKHMILCWVRLCVSRWNTFLCSFFPICLFPFNVMIITYITWSNSVLNIKARQIPNHVSVELLCFWNKLWNEIMLWWDQINMLFICWYYGTWGYSLLQFPKMTSSSYCWPRGTQLF